MAGEALSKTASATSLTIAFHKKCDKEWRKLRDKLEAQFQEDIGRLYAKSLYWDLEVVVNCKTIRTHHSILQVRAPKFFSHLCATREPSSPNSRFSSAALEKASVDYLESFIRSIYVKNSIEEEENSVLQYLDNIIIGSKKFDSGFGDSEKNDSILSPESDIYVTPKTSPSEIIEQFGLINKDNPLSNGISDGLTHSCNSFLPLEKTVKESICSKKVKSLNFDSTEDSTFPLTAKSPISDRDAQASYYSIVPVDDVCREERPRHLDLRGKGFSPAFGNPAGEALEKELAEQDELLKSFQSILSKEEGKSERTKFSLRRSIPVGRGSPRLGIPVRDHSRPRECAERNPRPSREILRKDGNRNLGTKSKEVSISRLPVRKQPKRVNAVAAKNANEKYPVSFSLADSHVPHADQDSALSFILNRSCTKDAKEAASLDVKPKKSGSASNHQDGTGSEMDGVVDYHEELGRPSKLSPYSCEAEEEEEDFLCSACSPCSPDMEGASSSQLDSGLDTGTSGSGGNPPPGGGVVAGDPTPSDATSATTSSSWHCLHSVSSPLLPRDPSVPQLLSPSFVSMTAEGSGEPLGILAGAECNSVAIGEDDTEAAVLSKLKSSSVSVSSGAVSDTDDVGMMEYDEADVRCENGGSVKHTSGNVEETNKSKEPISFSDSMTKSIEVYQTFDSQSHKGPEMAIPVQESVGGPPETLPLKLTNGIDDFCEEEGISSSSKLDRNHISTVNNSDSQLLMKSNDVPNEEEARLDCVTRPKMEVCSPTITTNPNLQLNGIAYCKDDDVQAEKLIENGHESTNYDDAAGSEAAQTDRNSSSDGKTETEAHEPASHSDLSSFDGVSSETCEDNVTKATQHFFIDAATLLDDNEFVPSLDVVQSEIQETPLNVNSHEESLSTQKEEYKEKNESSCALNNTVSIVDQTSDVEACRSEAVEVADHLEIKQLLPRKDENHIDAKTDSPHHCVLLHDAAPTKAITIVEKFQQEIFVSQTCVDIAMPLSEPKHLHLNDLVHEVVDGKSEIGVEECNDDLSLESKVKEPLLVAYQRIPSEVCTTNELSSSSAAEGICGSVILEKGKSLTKTENGCENAVVVGGNVALVSDDFVAQKIHSPDKPLAYHLKPDVHDSEVETNKGKAVPLTEALQMTAEVVTNKGEAVPLTEALQMTAEVVPERVEHESSKRDIVTKTVKSKNDVLPTRVGELIRGDTFELEPGEERVTWFRQEHERRQGSMLFQGLQRRSSVDSINKADHLSSTNNFVGTEKMGNHSAMPGQPGQYSTSSMALTQSLPPMLSTGMSIPPPPTPPNTLHRVKNHHQVPAIPLTTATVTVDTIHKLFGDHQRMQGDVDAASPIQRFSQRLRPSREEDIQSPDSLNNDGPMETFCRDSVLINRIPVSGVGAPVDAGEEEEETGPIVEKQTDEYLEKERRDDDDDDGRRPVVSGALTDVDVAPNPVVSDILKRQKRNESTPIVSGGASAADFAQISPSRPIDSPLARRRTEATPILSGGGPPLEEPKKEVHQNGSPRCPRRWDGTPPPLSAWVVDMSDCCKGDSSNFGPSSLNSSWSPSTPEARKRHRRRRSEGMPFAVGSRGLRAVEFSEQPADEVTPTGSFDGGQTEVKDVSAEKEDKSSEDVGSSSAEDTGSEKKKPLFSMFIDIGDSCKTSGTKGKDFKRPRELSSAMSVSWQGGSSHSRAMTESVESVTKSTSMKPSEAEVPKSSDSTKSGSVFMYIDASQPPKVKPEPEKETKVEEHTKEEVTSQGSQRERQGFFMFIEAEPTPPVMRKPFHLKDGHLTSTPPSKRHSWNQEVPNILEGMVGQAPSVRRHKRTQSLSVVGRSSSGSSVPHLLESASGEDSDHASQSASISSVSAGQVSTSVAGSSLSLVEGLDSGSSTGEFKMRGPIVKSRPMIGSSPENMGSSFEGSSKCQIPEEEYEEKSREKVKSKAELTRGATVSMEEESSHRPLANAESNLGNTGTLSSPLPEDQKKSAPSSEEETHVGVRKPSRHFSDSHMSDIKESAEDDTKKQFVKLSDLDKSTTTVDGEGVMVESCESFGNEDILSSSSGSRRVRPVEEISWIESKARQGVCGGGGSRGRLLYPMGLGKGSGRSRRGRSESPGKNGSNSGGSPAPLHRGEVAEEQPLSETASALSSMQSSVDRSALEGSTEETDMSSSLGGSRSAPCSRLGQDLLRMFLDEVNTDVTVEVEGHSVRAHKCILSSRCQYFAAMLSGGWVESAGNVISLQGFSYSAVHFALCHIYSGTSNIPETISIVELATLADMLGLEGLKEVIMYTLKVKYCHFFHKPCAVCAVGVLECLPLAAAYGLDEIYRKSLKWITKYFIRIWPSKAFAALPRELIDKCYHQHVVHMSVENILDTVMCCDKLLATLPNVRWAEPVFGITSQLLEASVKFIADNFSGVVLSDKFQSLGKELSWNISRLEESVAGAADMLSLEQACLSYINISHLLSTTNSPDQETHEIQWSTNFVEFLRRLETRVEGRLVRGAGRVARCRSWMQLDAQVRRRIQEKACLVGLDHSSSGGSSRRRRIGGEEDDGGSSSGCGGSDDTGGSIGRRGRSRHSSLLRTNEQRPASARASASSSIYCTIPRSGSGRAKGKDGAAVTDTRSKVGNGAVPGTSAAAPSQSQAVAAATALLDTKHKPARKERSGTSVGTLGNRSKSSSGKVHQKVQEEVKPVPKKESSVSSVVARPRKKVSQLDKEKSASTVVGKSDGKPTQPAEGSVSRPKTWPMRVMEQSKSSRSSPQLQPPSVSAGGISSSTGTPEKAGSVSSRVRISSSDSSRNSSPALRPKGVMRGAKTSRTFTPTRVAKKPEATQQISSPGGGSQTQLIKEGTSSPRRVGGAKTAASRPTPDSASSRASNSPVANLRRTASSRTVQPASSVTPTPKRTIWSRTKPSGPALVKQNSAGAVPSPPRASSVRSGNEVATRKIAPGSKPRTPLAERSTRPFSPKAVTVSGGGSSVSGPVGSKKKAGPLQGALIHSRNGSTVSLDKGKGETVAPSGVGERSGTFLKDEPTVLKRPENAGAD